MYIRRLACQQCQCSRCVWGGEGRGGYVDIDVLSLFLWVYMCVYIYMHMYVYVNICYVCIQIDERR